MQKTCGESKNSSLTYVSPAKSNFCRVFARSQSVTVLSRQKSAYSIVTCIVVHDVTHEITLASIVLEVGRLPFRQFRISRSSAIQLEEEQDEYSSSLR